MKLGVVLAERVRCVDPHCRLRSAAPLKRAPGPARDPLRDAPLLPTQVGGTIEAGSWACRSRRLAAYCRPRSVAPLKRSHQRPSESRRPVLLLPTLVGSPIEAWIRRITRPCSQPLLPTPVGSPIGAITISRPRVPCSSAYCRLRSAAPLKRPKGAHQVDVGRLTADSDRQPH